MTFKGRTCLYHSTCPEGRIFTDVGEYRLALESGWVDAPWEINNPAYVPAELGVMSPEVPGHEVRKAGQSPPDVKGSKETKPPEASPPIEPLKPWQKAVAARKAKAAARQGG